MRPRGARFEFWTTAGRRGRIQTRSLRDIRRQPIGAYAIAAVEQEASGDDTTLLLLEIAPSVSRTKLKALLKGAIKRLNVCSTCLKSNRVTRAV